MTLADYAPLVLRGTPPWVWGVFFLLLALGVRRLKPRRTRLHLAALAPVAFTIWSLTGVLSAARGGSPGPVIAVWAAALAAGALTALVHPGRRPTHLGGDRFLFCGSVVPLLLYMGVFWARYVLGVWAAFQPGRAELLTLAAIAISAATAGRFAADIAPLVRGAAGPEPLPGVDATLPRP